MMPAITVRFNNSLKSVWNIDDPIYRALICDGDGTIPSIINKPTDIDIGAIAGDIEYLRILSQSLIKQICVDTATSEYLKYTLQKFFGSTQLEGEDEATWIQRVNGIVFSPKVSRASIIYALRPYSPNGEPEIVNTIGDAMFADVSFADRYKRETQTVHGKNFSVYPAYSQTAESSFYAITVILYGATQSSLFSIVDIIKNMIAAGIYYTIEIR